METIYEFTLPKGYVDNNGGVHRVGKMRLATAGDEISATRDPRVLSNTSYLTIVILYIQFYGIDFGSGGVRLKPTVLVANS